MTENVPPEATPVLPEDKTFVRDYHRFSDLYLETRPGETKEIKAFGQEFLRGFQAVRKVYKEGGEIGGVKFEPCQLKAHGWNHIENDVLIVLKTLPGFLHRHPGQYSVDQVKALLWGILLHDTGYLMTTTDIDEKKYSWAGELNFDHVDRGIALVKKLLPALTENPDEKTVSLVEDTVAITDFNKDTEDIKKRITQTYGEGTENLLEIVWAADLLSYFTDPNDIPNGLQDLFWEYQARVKPGDVGDYVLNKESRDNVKQVKKIADVRGVSEEEVWQDYRAGRLTVADIKFPGQNIHQFLASDFTADMQKKMEQFLKYTDYWFGKGENELRKNYAVTVDRAQALKYIDSMPEKKDSYCFFEGAFAGIDLQRWVTRLREGGIKFEEGKGLFDKLKLEGQAESDYWTEVDKRVLGATPVAHPFDRLITREIKGVLEAIPVAQQRQDALADLLLSFLEKNKGGGGCEEYEMRLSPGAYEGILTPEQIFGAFEQANKESSKRRPILADYPKRELHFVWTIRRDQNELDAGLVAQLIRYKEQGKVFHVDFAGKENNQVNTKIATYAPLLKTLIDNDLLVSLQVAQIFPGVADGEVAQENLKAALTLIKQATKKNVLLVGLQHLDTPACRPLINDVVASGVPVVASISHDGAVFGDKFPGEKHPVQLLWPKGVKILFGTADSAFLQSAIAIEVLKALLLINPQADKILLRQQADKIFEPKTQPQRV
jgi:hypothetical protein